MAEHGELRSLVRETLNTNKTKLWTHKSLAEELELDVKQASNVLYQLWQKGEICRHKDKSVDNFSRYAKKIAEENALVYVKSEKKNRTRKSSGKVDIKEIRKSFQDIINIVLTLEAEVIGSLQENAEQEKLLKKAKEALDKY